MAAAEAAADPAAEASVLISFSFPFFILLLILILSFIFATDGTISTAEQGSTPVQFWKKAINPKNLRGEAPQIFLVTALEVTVPSRKRSVWSMGAQAPIDQTH